MNAVRHEKLVFKINKMMAYCLVAWACCPLIHQKMGLLTGAVLSIAWVISALVVNPIHALNKDDLCMVAYFILMCCSYVLLGRVYGTYSLLNYLPVVMLFFLPYYIFRFYRVLNRDDVIAHIAVIGIVFTAIGAVMSIFYCIEFPGIMKSIDMIENSNVANYRTVGIGTFGYVYMLMLCTVASVDVVMQLRKSSIKVLVAFFSVIGLTCIVYSTLTTALIFTVVGILLAFSVRNNRSGTLQIIMVFSLVLLIVFRGILGNWLLSVTMESQEVTERLHEIGNFLNEGKMGINIDARAIRLENSIKCIFNYPLFGFNFQNNPKYFIGGHCEWFDIFAVYGLVGGFPVVCTIFLKIKYIYEQLKSVDKKIGYRVVVFVFIFFGFIDPFLRLFHVGFGLFLIVPGLYLLQKCTNKKEGIINEGIVGN